MSSNEEKFTVDCVGETTEKAWKGVFKTKLRLSHRDTLKQDETKRELLGKNPESAGDRALNTAEIFSFLAVHLLEVPQWWEMNGRGLELEDDNVVAEVYGKVVKVKSEAIAARTAKAEADRAELKKVE